MTRAGRHRFRAVGRRPEARAKGAALLPGLARTTLERLRAHAFVDLGGDHTDAAFLAGSGRSGTTWVAQAVARGGGYRLIFEPFDPRRVPPVRAFRSKQYLRPQDTREEFLGPARTVLSGGVRGRWVDRFNRVALARRRVVKDVRANLLLGWLDRQFPGMPLVLILRHPCAVVRSRLRLGWRDNLDETLEQPELVEDHLLPFEGRLRRAATPFERHLFLWCIDNYVPLRQLDRGRLHVVFFENLVLEPRAALPPLFDFLGFEVGEEAYASLLSPSPLHSGEPGDRLAAWQHETSREELRATLEALSLFGLDGVYGAHPMPDPAGLAMGGRA